MTYAVDRYAGTFLITGATGLIGRQLVKALLEKNTPIKLILLSRSAEKARRVFGDTTDSRLVFLEQDIQKEAVIPEPVDYIIHCAAITGSKTMVEHPVDAFLTTVEGTRHMLKLAYEKGIKAMVYLSSMEMYGNMEGIQPEHGKTTEEMLGYLSLDNPRTVYPEGKRAAEILCTAYYQEYGVPVKTVRLAQTFGAGVGLEESRVFAQFAKSAMAGKPIVLHTDGSSEGNFCHLSDAVNGIFTVLFRGQAGEAYNITNETAHMTIREMAELVAKEIAPIACGHEIPIIYDIPENSRQYGYAQKTKLFLSAEKIRKLGWTAQYGMKEMYLHMLEGWKGMQDERLYHRGK